MSCVMPTRGKRSRKGWRASNRIGWQLWSVRERWKRQRQRQRQQKRHEGAQKVCHDLSFYRLLGSYYTLAEVPEGLSDLQRQLFETSAFGTPECKEDPALLGSFRRKMDNLAMEDCETCGERWFEMGLDSKRPEGTPGVCKRCRGQAFPKFSEDNKAHFGSLVFSAILTTLHH